MRALGLGLVLLEAAAVNAVAQRPGQALFESNCAGCHGLDGRGGEHAPNIASVERVRQLSDDELIRTIRDGIRSGGMPAFGAHLSPGQLRAVTAYVRALQGERKTPAALPGDPGNGRAVFFGKGGCGECHMVASKGGFLAHDLSSFASAHSTQEMRQAIVHPDSEADPHHGLATVSMNDGRRYTGVIRNEDNSSVQLLGRNGEFYLIEKSSVRNIEREKKPLMPGNYGETLEPSEINDLISYLMQVATTQPKQAEDHSEW